MWIPNDYARHVARRDPASPLLNGFHDVLAELKLPLIVHAGWEHERMQRGNQEYGNPLRLRRALDRGARVVVAHCATQGDFDESLPALIDHIQGHNPPLFDFVLKRCLSHQGARLPNEVFACAGAFAQAIT